MKQFKSIVIAALAVVVGAVYAVPVAQVAAVSSSSLSIAPRKDYTIGPGKTIEDKLLIRNLDGESELQLSLRAIDFSFDDKIDSGGSPKLFLDQNATQTTWSLRPFIKLPQSVTVPAKGSVSIDYSITIPENQGAGSYYSAIVYSSGSGEGGNVGLSASGVTLVFANVPGEVKQDLQLKQFGAYNILSAEKGEFQFFTTQEPQRMGYTLQNSGNVAESPMGSISLKNVLFGKEYQIESVNPNKSLVLLGQTRTFTSCIKTQAQRLDFEGSRTEATQCTESELWPGIYTAQIDLLYGQNGNLTKEISKTTTFFYFPWWFIAVVVAVLAIIGYFVWKIVRAIRGRKNGKAKKSASKK